jgi:uncharacterized membrane protein YjjP (DUF1212 family)
MPFVILGIFTLLVGAFFLRLGVKNEDKEILVGSVALVIAGIVLVIFFGLFYNGLTLLTS